MLRIVFLMLVVGLNPLGIASDDDFCTTQGVVSDDGKTYTLPYRDESERYQVFYEKVRDIQQVGFEVREFYDGLKNIGVAVISTLDMDYSIYAYYDHNELVVVTDNTCKVSKLNESIQETPFEVITVDGKPHIATALTLISHNVSSKNVAYLGSKNRFVRGIPVRQWLFCSQDDGPNGIQHKIIISYSDPEKWSPALQSPGYESIPVKMEVVMRTDLLPDIGDATDSYNLFDFRPGLSIREEAYYVPTGVYCPNRLTKKPFPKIPKSYSMLAGKTALRLDSGGAVKDIRYEYSDEKKVLRIDYTGDADYAEMIDFETQIVYEMSKQTGDCTLNKFETFLTPWMPFLEDQLPEYQYVGQRQVRGINTDVWIAPRQANLGSVLYEWYFTADGWQTLSSSPASPLEHVPVLLMRYQQQYIESMMDVYSFHPDSVDLLAFDLTPCLNFQKMFSRFTVSGSSNSEIISNNKQAFKEATLLALEKSTQVRLLRIGGIEVVFDDKVYVLFNLFNKSLLAEDAEPTLEESFKLLKSDFDEKKFIITFKDKSSKQITIEPDWKSLETLSDDYNRFYSTVVIKTLGTNGVIAALIIIAGLIVGVILGVFASIFIQVRKRDRSESSLPQMMSISNPSSEID